MQTEQHTALDELRTLKQWVAWEPRTKPGRQKLVKVPINPHTGAEARTNDPSTWSTYGEAVDAADDGRIGFVFTGDDGYTGVDLDNCIDEGVVAGWADKIVADLDSYTEISPSGTGLHIYVKATKPDNNHCKYRDENREIEIYDRTHYFTFTGDRYGSQDAIQDRQSELNALYVEVFGGEKKKPERSTTTVSDGFRGSDEELLEKARNANGTGERFTRLYDHGDISLAKNDHSAADIKLCGMLAFWVACDEERMDRLFRRSKLMRKKWDEVHYGNGDTYGEHTIAIAIKNCNNTYEPKYKISVGSSRDEVLQSVLQIVYQDPWNGRGGPSERKVLKELINTGLRYGRLVDGGVEVSAGVRNLAVGAGIKELKPVRGALKRLEVKKGLIKKVKPGGGGKAATYLIRVRKDTPYINCVNTYGVVLRATQRIRNPSSKVRSIGTRNAQIIDFVYLHENVIMLEDIVKYLNIKRCSDLLRRNISTLLDAGLLEEKDGGYVTPDDVEKKLLEHLESGGSLKAEGLQQAKYERERQAYRRAIQVARMENEARYEEPSTPTVLIPSTNTVNPTLKKEPKTILTRRNLPPKDQDEIFHHSSMCDCFMCEEESPEYVPIEQEEMMAA